MKQFRFLKWWQSLAVASLCGGFVVRAQEIAPANRALSLDSLVKETLEKNPELAFYQAEITAAKGARKTAGALANPELSAGVNRKSVRGPGASGDGVAWSVSLMQPFEWPGRLGLRKAIANRDIELANLGLERFRTALAGRVRTLAYGLFAAQEKAAAAREVEERFRELREVLVQRDPAGLTPLLETRVIEATELNAQRKASEAVLAQQSALLELNQLRGNAPEAALVVSQAQLTFPAALGKDILVSLARTNNFEVRVRTVELEQQGFRVNLARNERRPVISVGPFVSHESAGGDRELQMGVGLSLPLPLWNRNQGNVATAEARRVQAETSLLLTLREVERKVLEAALTYETKVREMARWRPDSVAHFRDAAEVADRHYRLGAVPISTYVELQKQYLDAVDALLETKHEALEASVQLELLTGNSLNALTAKEISK